MARGRPKKIPEMERLEQELGRKIEFNKICLGCKNKCKQFAWVDIFSCKPYKSIEDKPKKSKK